MTRLAIAHDWLLNRRGAERVLKEFCLGLDRLEIHTLFLRSRLIDDAILRHPIQSSLLSRLPGVPSYYRYLLPLYPAAAKGLKVNGVDALLSISHVAAKCVAHNPDIPHFCYCLTPARFLWAPELYEPELNGSWKGRLLDALSGRLKQWDLDCNSGVDRFVTISQTVRDRIRRVYGYDSTVIHPCIDLDLFQPSDVDREDFYLMVSGLVPQKRLDLAVEAFTRNGKPLWIVGEGPLRRRLERLAGPQIRFLGWQTDSEVAGLYRRARALIFPSLDEFGLVPVEAQACGCPIIAFGKGGVTETVIEGTTGVFFRSSTPEALTEAVEELERDGVDPAKCVENARGFSRQRFFSQWKSFFEDAGVKLDFRSDLQRAG